MNKILAAFEKNFPECWFKEGNDFDHSTAVVWSGEGSTINGESAFNYNGWEFDPKEEVWIMGIHRELFALAETFGCYWECHDPGTYLLYKN